MMGVRWKVTTTQGEIERNTALSRREGSGEFLFAAIIITLALVAGLLLLIAATYSANQTPARTHRSSGPSFRFGDMVNGGLVDATELPIRTKVRGVSFKSQSTGERREFVIQTRCAEGDALALVRESTNPHDGNSVLICRMVLNEQRGVVEYCDDLGHLSRQLAEKIAPRMDGGECFVARISAITGDLEVDDEDDGYNAGVNIYIHRVTGNSQLAKTMAAARM